MDGSACGESEKTLAAVDDAARRNFNNYLSRSLLCCLRLLLPHMMTARTDSNVYINFRSGPGSDPNAANLRTGQLHETTLEV